MKVLIKLVSECGGEATERLLTSQPSLAATYESSVRGWRVGRREEGEEKNGGEEEGRKESHWV